MWILTEKLLGKIVKFIQNKMKKQKVRQHLRPSISFFGSIINVLAIMLGQR